MLNVANDPYKSLPAGPHRGKFRLPWRAKRRIHRFIQSNKSKLVFLGPTVDRSLPTTESFACSAPPPPLLLSSIPTSSPTATLSCSRSTWSFASPKEIVGTDKATLVGFPECERSPRNRRFSAPLRFGRIQGDLNLLQFFHSVGNRS